MPSEVLRAPLVLNRLAPKPTAMQILAPDPPNLLMSTLAPPSTAPPFKQTDWTLPLQKPTMRPSYYARPSSAAPAVAIPLPISAGAIFDVPWRVRSSFSLQTFVKPLDAFLVPAVVGVQPFLETEWPLPLGKAAHPSLRMFTSHQNVNLANQDALPFRQNEWVNPTGKPFALENRTYLDPLNLVLVNQDRFFGGNGQPPTYPTDPVPLGKSYPVGLRTWTQSLNTLLLTTFVQVPAQNVDWAIPQAKPFPLLHRFHTSYYVLDDSAPFVQTQWPIPTGQVASSELRTFTDRLRLTLASADVLPFKQTDWRNPLAVPSARDLRTFTKTVSTLLIGLDALPFRQNDWPNPQAKQALRDLRTWLHSIDVNLVGTEQLPFRQNTWPNPMGPAALRELRTFLHRRSLVLPDVLLGLPLSQYHWPVPSGKPYPRELRTWVNSLQTSTLSPVFFPLWLANVNRYLNPTGEDIE